MSEHQQFFSDLLIKTKLAYESSEIKAKGFYYSVCATPIHLRSTLILGFNWGGREQKAQLAENIPNVQFNLMDTLGSMKRTINYFKKHFSEADQDGNPANFVQSNFCFFRSPKERDISQHDINLSVPLFEEFLQYVQPLRVISFSSKLKEYFANNNRIIKTDSPLIESGRNKFVASKGMLYVQDKSIPIFFLPHPNYPITRLAREMAWDYCFSKEKNPVLKDY